MNNHFQSELTGTIPADSEVAEIQLNIFDQLLFNHIEQQLDGDQCAHVIEHYAYQSELLDAEIAAAIVQTQLQQSAQEVG